MLWYTCARGNFSFQNEFMPSDSVSVLIHVLSLPVLLIVSTIESTANYAVSK